MHNSLWIRDRLREMNLDPLHRERRDPHRKIGWEDHGKPGRGDIELKGEWRIHGSKVEGMIELVQDLDDFLTKIGVDVSSTGECRIELGMGGDGPENSYRLAVTDGRIEIHAHDIEGLWAGVVRMEREMGMRRGPYLPKGEITACPHWKYQISQAPWGANYLVPDLGPSYLGNDSFRLLAHYGANGMTVYGDALLYVNSEILPELNHPDFHEHIKVLRETTERAAKYGISLFWVPVLPKLREHHPVFLSHPEVRGARLGWKGEDHSLFTLCSTSESSLEFLSEMTSGMFREVPLLGGLILIIGGESFYHCYMRPDLSGIGPEQRRTNCPRCSRRPAEEVVAGFVGRISAAVHEVKPAAVVAAWPYSASIWSRDLNQLDLIRRLPPDIVLLSEIDKDQLLEKERYFKKIWDYSVDFTGPSERIIMQSDACRKRDLPLFVKTETALGLEAIHMPYVPCMNRLEDKWHKVGSLSPLGVLQSWMFFGMWGSRAEELGWWKRWCPDVREGDLLSRIAKRDFGNAWKRVLGAWELVSQAVGHLPCIPPYFVGPWFLGPAHPLVDEKDWRPPEVFQGALYYQQESRESLSGAMLESRSPLVLTELPESPEKWGFIVKEGQPKWATFVNELSEAVQLTGHALAEICPLTDGEMEPGDTGRLREEALIIEFLHRTLVSTLNFVRFEFLRIRGGNQEELKSILREELENAERARHLYTDAPWLDLSLRVDGQFPSSKAMLNAKIDLLKKALD